MTVFSSLQTLAEKRTPGEWNYFGGSSEIATPAVDIAADPYLAIGQSPSSCWPEDAPFIVELVNAWPLLEAAVKTLIENVENENLVCIVDPPCGDCPNCRACDVVSSLTGEPRDSYFVTDNGQDAMRCGKCGAVVTGIALPVHDCEGEPR